MKSINKMNKIIAHPLKNALKFGSAFIGGLHFLGLSNL
jgi:hypothetical protein